ncbi:GNAT family N-acetyltransferase [Paenibacillus turpanensis]|uniref:GNAT family N-acetyltransferase n=1 Tax=Paenibacillus turpanensis TaxID=2689078 RepID=UPI0014077012|nr:GNAT family N-acetyltransferase [Paenibacillus turpanensis]
MQIREAVLEDLPRLLDIYNYAVRETVATFDLTEQTLEQRSEWFGKYGGRFPLIVAELDGVVAGYSCLSSFRAKPAYDRTAELSVYIDPEYWGRGVGKRLMKEIIERGKAVGHHSIVACITGGNEVSVKLHEQLGFRFVGTFRECGYKFDAWQDVSFYELLI